LRNCVRANHNRENDVGKHQEDRDPTLWEVVAAVSTVCAVLCIAAMSALAR
jgi:hypothetical protein